MRVCGALFALLAPHLGQLYHCYRNCLTLAPVLLCVQVRHSPQLVCSLLQHMAPHLGHLKPRELAGSLWALHRLRQQPPEGWLEALYEESQGRLASLRPDEVAVLTRGLAGVQVRHLGCFVGRSVESVLTSNLRLAGEYVGSEW
jgi:hypothetical protein